MNRQRIKGRRIDPERSGSAYAIHSPSSPTDEKGNGHTELMVQLSTRKAVTYGHRVTSIREVRLDDDDSFGAVVGLSRRCGSCSRPLLRRIPHLPARCEHFDAGGWGSTNQSTLHVGVAIKCLCRFHRAHGACGRTRFDARGRRRYFTVRTRYECVLYKVRERARTVRLKIDSRRRIVFLAGGAICAIHVYSRNQPFYSLLRHPETVQCEGTPGEEAGSERHTTRHTHP